MDSKKNPPFPAPQQMQIVHSPAPDVPTDIDLMAVIERRNEMMSRILDYAIRATHPGQWVDQSGKPFPMASAAEVMARRCAVSIKNVQTNKVPSSDERGHFYMYVATATASLPGGYDSIEAMGTCSSRDTFLGTDTKAGRQLSEIDEGNILKAAYSNMLVNAITRLLGVRNLTWEKLAELGIDQGRVAKVEYNSGSRGGGSSAEWSAPFGREKGKRVTDVQDLAYFAKKYREDIANPEKAKYLESNKKALATIDAELARRKGSAGEVRAPSEQSPRTVAEPNPAWARVQLICKEAGIAKPAEFTKSITGKDHSSKVDGDDAEKVRGAIESLRLGGAVK